MAFAFADTEVRRRRPFAGAHRAARARTRQLDLVDRDEPVEVILERLHHEVVHRHVAFIGGASQPVVQLGGQPDGGRNTRLVVDAGTRHLVNVRGRCANPMDLRARTAR